MAGNYAQLLDIINNPTQHGLPAWDNNAKQIKGETIQQYLLYLIQSLTVGYQFMGVASENTSGGTPDQNVFYIAGAGIYTDFGSNPITIDAGCIGIIRWNGAWSSDTIKIANESAWQGVKNLIITPILEIGTIIGGQNTESTTRFRAKEYINGESIITDINPSYVLLGCAVYNLNGSFIDWIDLTSFSDTILLPNSQLLYRPVFKKSDDGTIVNGDLVNNVFVVIPRNKYFDINYNTPTEKQTISDWLNAYINTSLQVVASENSKVCQPQKLLKGDSLILETSNIYSYTIFIMENGTSIAIGDTITPTKQISRIGNSNEKQIMRYEYTANNDCYAIVNADKYKSKVFITRNVISDIIGNARERINAKFVDGNVPLDVYIASNNLWDYARNKGAILFDVYKGQTVKIKANPNYPTIYALLKKDTGFTFNTSPDFVDWTIGRNSIVANGYEEIAIYEDCWLYIYNMTGGGAIYFPATLDITGTINDTNNIVFLDVKKPLMYMQKGIDNTNKWRYQSYSLRSSCIFEVEKGDKILIRSNNTNYAIVAFISKLTGEQDENVVFANGTSSRIVINAKNVQSFDVSENCYLYVYLQSDGGDVYAPLSIYKNGKTETNSVTRNSINIVNDVLLASLNNDGTIVKDELHITTKKLRINIGEQWYKRGIYLHCCSVVGYNGQYGFNATKVVFFDSENNVISYETDIDEALTIPNGAFYAIVEFAKSSFMHFVCVSNQSILSEYSNYDGSLLTNTKLPKYEKVVNNDGAISNMLDVALDYMKRGSLGYGDIATAFDDVVEPVESEFTPPMYEGEKMQINCSTFVMLCIMGIFYKNSRYYKPNGINIGNAFKFDAQAEYNYYYTAAPYQHILGANFGKMYANKLAKYAFDRGLLYIVKNDRSNIKVGDVLFNGYVFDDSNRFFKGIGHTLIVTDIELKADGAQRIVIMENGAGESELNQRVTFGARFPLPDRFIERKNIITNFSAISENVSGDALENVVLGTYTLNETIKPQSQFTLIVKGNLPDDINVGVIIGSNTIEIDRRTLYQRGDGTNLKHFHFFIDSSVNASQISLFVNSDSIMSSKLVEIDSVELLKGFFTE